MRAPLQIALAAAALLFPQGPAFAEQLVTTIAPSKISVASNYSGGTVVVFGAIQTGNVPARPYDIVITATGPVESVVARRKERVAGIWINRHSRTFIDIPSFLGVFANRPFNDIAAPEVLQRQKIGFDNTVFAIDPAGKNDPYLANVVDIRVNEKLYVEQPGAVTFLSPTVFRAEIALPANVLIGYYSVNIKLLANKALLSQADSGFTVAKVGVEEFVVRASIDNSLIYGLATMLMALLTGWLASVAFRRD